MHDTLVTLKSGTQYRGYIWKVRLAEGYFTLGGALAVKTTPPPTD